MADSPDPAVTEAPPPLPPPPRRSPILPLVAGGAIAAALGFAAAQYLPLTRTDTTDLQAKLDAQFTELATLKSQLLRGCVVMDRRVRVVGLRVQHLLRAAPQPR